MEVFCSGSHDINPHLQDGLKGRVTGGLGSAHQNQVD